MQRVKKILYDKPFLQRSLALKYYLKNLKRDQKLVTDEMGTEKMVYADDGKECESIMFYNPEQFNNYILIPFEN